MSYLGSGAEESATKHPWLVACDADMNPVDFEKRLWFRKDQMHVMAPEGASTCGGRL